MRDLTKEELEALDSLGKAWNKFLMLPIIHSDHQDEFRHGIHELQRIIMCRPVGEFLRDGLT